MIINFTRLRRDVMLGVKNLLLHKLRSLLTMLGLVFGVGSVIAMLAVGEGASAEALSQIRKLGSCNIIISAKKPSSEDNLTQNTAWLSIYGLTYKDNLRISETIPTITSTVPVKSLSKEARFRKRDLELRLVGTSERWFDLVKRDIIAGRSLNARDIESKASVAVLTEYGARRLLATESVIGQVLRIGGEAYEIVGIVQSESITDGSIQTPDKQTDVYIPITTAKQHFGDAMFLRKQGSNIREYVELHHLIVNVDKEENVEATAAAIEHVLKHFHKNDDYEINVPLALLRQTEATKKTFSIVLGAIAGISLLVGGIGIMNIMLATVTERTREIGIRRAIGARRNQIVTQFLIETLVLSLIGGLIGIGLGVFIPWIVTLLAKMPTIVTIQSLVLSMGISVSVGVIFGIYPAIRASKLDPIIALRHE